MRQIFRYAILTVSFALVAYGLLAWQHLDFSLAALTDFSPSHLHPVFALILGLGLLPPTVSEFVEQANVSQERHEG
ncbi:MAG: hypothetical protein CBC52_003900 [Gammaproteobacteria bacterium TMED92]|nr:MAG: hypothetical protein CBC52_003900 [Gammaproteobacteria bacterium TMED92]